MRDEALRCTEALHVHLDEHVQEEALRDCNETVVRNVSFPSRSSTFVRSSVELGHEVKTFAQ